MAFNVDQMKALLYQALETELGGVRIYETALHCARNEDLKKEWEKYHEETKNHVEIVRGIFEELDLDPELEVPGREVVRHIGASLVKAMEMAQEEAPEAAELVAAECVVLAETKDHLNWELIGVIAKKARGAEAKALKSAYEEVEDEEDRHLYHTMGFLRELWIQSLGFPAVLPPPEEVKDVDNMAAAAKAKSSRTKMTK